MGFEGIGVERVVVLRVLVHNSHKGVHKEGMDLDHVEVFGGMELVSMMVVAYVEKGVHRHMIVELDNQKKAHHIH
ncbi:hypothetical protein AHAS_Ahas18G0200400 [Arachis hypogaea]